DGNVVYDFDVDGETIKQMAKKILPYFAKGYLTNNFDEYYKVFGEEMAKLYERCLLDGNGDPQYGTGISEREKQNNINEMNTNYVYNGKYSINSYDFANDWRLDPLATVDDVEVYIDGVLKATGKDKVCLACKCLGGDLILAYLAKYGTKKIHAVCFGSTVAFGGDLANDMFSGRMKVDGESLTRFVNDDYVAKFFSNDQQLVYEFIKETMNLAEATGVADFGTDAFMKLLYNRLYEGLVPALATATYGTWPGYWTMITADRYEEAKAFVFGDKNSEKYQYYAGLIEKLDNYDTQVRQRIPELLKAAEADGVNICIVSKYGFQMPPVIESRFEQGDVWTTTRYSSLGATVSRIGTTLSDEYIDSRKALGLEKYISPDKQVDASTCVFPEYTWFIKGAIHDDWTKEEDRIITTVCDSDERITINNLDDRPQFLVYDRENDTVYPMTEDNCDTETYEVNAKPKNVFLNMLTSLFKWLKAAFEFLSSLTNK
ncbi:MAG: hypothetical protein ACI4SB_05855, partial [Acutalibacteraceae bacterium]